MSVSDAIIVKMKVCPWKLRLATIEGEVVVKIKDIECKIKVGETGNESKQIKSKIRRVRKTNKAATNPEVKAALATEEDVYVEELRDISEKSILGNYNLIHAGIKELEEVLKTRPKKQSKRPESDIQYVLWKSIESRAGGCLASTSSRGVWTKLTRQD